jgi:hypothetical protein
MKLSSETERRIGMRKALVVALALCLVGGLALPAPAPARPVTVLGSLTITGDGNVALANNAITGFAVIANPGLEKTIVQQLPPYTLPVFLDGDGPDGSPSLRLLRRNLDTTVVLTNTTDAVLVIEITVRNAAGVILAGPRDLTFAAHETRTFQLADILP